MPLSKPISSVLRFWSVLAMRTLAVPPRSNWREKLRALGSNAISLIFTIGRPSTSTGPIRKDDPNAVGAMPAGARGRRRQ